MFGPIRLRIFKIKRLLYDLKLVRKITLINDISATGKSTLCNIINEINKRNVAYKLDCDYDCLVIDNSNWQLYLNLDNKILFIDEDFDFSVTKGFSKFVKTTNNFIIFINRRSMRGLIYSYKEIYKLKSIDNVIVLENKYKNGDTIVNIKSDKKYLILEDSNSGFELLNKCFNNIKVISSNGKFNIINKLEDDNCIIIADGAAFGSEIDKLILYLYSKNIKYILYLPESVEYLLLVAFFNYKLVIEEIDINLFSNWERFFTRKLMDITKENKLIYSKSKIDNYFIKNSYKLTNILPIELKEYLINNNENEINELFWE